MRNGQLTFDVGWVGFVTGGPRIDDGQWHHVAMTWRRAEGLVTLFVDGETVGEKPLPLRDDHDQRDFTARFGWTSVNFPGTSRFSGFMDGPAVLRVALDEDEVPALAAMTGAPLVEATVVEHADGTAPDPTAARIEFRGEGASTTARLLLGSASDDARYVVRRRRGPRAEVLAWAREERSTEDPIHRPFRIDRITRPIDNPHESWMRFGAFDFLPGGEGAMITTWSGDVWRVDGLDERLDVLEWKRVATGLNQPFGLVIDREGQPLVLGRDQITRLVDHNSDGEADSYINVSNLGRNSEHFHEPASGLLVEPDGSYLYHKAARHAKLALHTHHGTVIRVSPDGRSQQVVAHGFRAPIGLMRLPDGSLMGTDQEGHWTPANRINLIRIPDRESNASTNFYGNGWGAPRKAGRIVERGGESVHAPWSESETMTPPLCWVHPSVDRSPSSQVYLDHPAWGPLRGKILGLSYGIGGVYLILKEDVDIADGATVTQGGIVKLGIEVPTGLLAGRIHPSTGDLYVCGLVGWSSDQTDDGGFYRVRPNPSAWAQTLNVPIDMKTHADGLELTFLAPLDRAAATEPDRWLARAWNYQRTANYGSANYDLAGRRDAQTKWRVRAAELAPDQRTVRLRIEDFEPAMQVHIAWSINDANGRALEHEAHLTLHVTDPTD